MIKEIIKPLLPKKVLRFIDNYRSQKQLIQWTKNGKPIPPPHIVKQLTIAKYQQKFGYALLVETGTFMGDMVEANKKIFNQIISIELAHHLFEKAKKRFEKDKKVRIVQGDSGKILPLILKNINEPAIFWLDGHYSEGITAKGEKECPIFEELDAIFNSKKFNHVLLIDDARLFVGEHDYPTIDELTNYVKNKNEKYRIEIKHDIIRFVI